MTSHAKIYDHQLADSILEQTLLAIKQTERSQALSLLHTFVENVLIGVVVWEQNIARSINHAIKVIDHIISKQLQTIMHAEIFLQLEGHWRGLYHLVSSSETGSSLRIKVLPSTKAELFHDLDKAVEFDQSQLFQKIYETEYGTAGGEPFSILVGDYEFTHHPDDIDMLSKISNISAAAFCPFISAASPQLVGLDSWLELNKPRDLSKLFETIDYKQWQQFRKSEDARFIILTLPRVLARLPYGQFARSNEHFHFDETESSNDKNANPLAHDHYCWMNAAYTLASRITEAYAIYGWTTAIRGHEGGGKVSHLPIPIFQSSDGDQEIKCPTEIGITDRRETELSRLGFLPLCHYKNTDYAVFFGAQSIQTIKKYDTHEGNANAAISSRLPYLLATSRFAHYLKMMARDKIGSFMNPQDCETWLNRWILNYVNSNADSNPELKAKYPLAEAKIEVKEISGQPGCYNAIAWLKPWLQMEELTTSLRLVARIPQLKR